MLGETNICWRGTARKAKCHVAAATILTNQISDSPCSIVVFPRLNHRKVLLAYDFLESQWSGTSIPRELTDRTLVTYSQAQNTDVRPNNVVRNHLEAD